MTGDLNPSPVPNEGGDNQSANKRDANPQRKLKPLKRQPRKWLGFTAAKWREIAGFVVLIPWIYNDLFDSHNFAKLLTLALSLAIAQGVVASFFKMRSVALLLWLVSLVPLAVVVFENSKPEPKPNFNFALRIGDSISPLALTNQCLLRSKSLNVITNFSDGTVLFKGIAAGCIVIPVIPGESNVVFTFNAENDSPIKASDLQICVGFPNDCRIGLDNSKWNMVSEHFFTSEYKFVITNLQFWSAQSPWPLFPTDSVDFPQITNSSIPESNSLTTNKNAVLWLYARSTGFEQFISANILFIRTTNFSKPFVTDMQLGKDGAWRAVFNTNEFINSQK